MGCAHSANVAHPRMFKAKNLDDRDKSVNNVVLEVQSSKVIVHSRNMKTMATWPIACIRRYGCNEDNTLFIEAGSGCDTGQGMYLFKCSRTDQIFELLRKHWSDLQAEREVPGPHTMGFSPIPSQTVIPTSNPSQHYYNVNNSSGPCHENSNGANGGVNYTNGCVRVATTPPINQVPPLPPAPRGSTSSQHASTLVSLPEDATLRLDTGEQPFALQPAPASRKEMISRRRINSDMPVASYNRNADRVTLGSPQRRNSESANYENNDVIGTSSGSFPRHHRVSYSKRTQQVKLDQSTSATSNNVAKNTTSTTNAVSPDVIDSVSRDVSLMSLRSDCEPLLTPGSKSSGIGSLNGNGGSLSSSNPPPIPPPISDPWKRHPQKFNHRHRISPSYVPHSAREYVNTTNASMDVSGTPLPATAVGGMHFNFDFDLLGFPHKSRSAGGYDRAKLNYVPIEVFKNGDDFNCGASSASSGIPGTPRTPKTPKTPLSSHPATDYAIIDHNKTRALSNTHRARQRERKSRHESTEMAVMNAV